MTDELIGKVVNGYEVISLVGQGGMARVYLALQQSMGRQVALKVLPTQFMTDDTYLQRFNREVTIASQLEHAHIIPVYDYGEYDGQPFIVMRYMPSGSVDDLLEKKGALPSKTILSIISQIAPALDYAHGKGVLHRDLKPSNILMDESGGAFITDFGIARLNIAKGATITTHGVVGTPSYMSPEQAQGKELDGRSDLYSLGVMLFELATGRRPFENDTPYSIAVMQVTTPPPQPRTFNPLLPTSVEYVILKALRKNPNDRYQTGQDFADALRQAIEHPEDDETDQKINTNALAQQLTSYAPMIQAQPPQAQPAQPSPMYPQQPVMSARYPSQSHAPVMPVKRRGSAMTGILVGGGIGCLFLAVLIGIAALAINFFLPARPTDVPNGFVTTSPVVTDAVEGSSVPAEASNVAVATLNTTLDATSESARATLLARQKGADATMTAVAPLSGTPGGMNGSSSLATPSIAPIGQRDYQPLNSALQGVSRTIIYADQRGEDSASFEIIRLDLETGVETQLTADNADNSYPIVSPDGRWVAFQSNRDGDFDIYVMNTDGGQLQRITDNTYLDRLPSWSPDGEWILYSADVRGDGFYDLYRSRLDGTATEVVLSNNERKSHARYSPDGRYIVYSTGTDVNDAGTWEIAVLDTQTGDIQILTQNATRDASPIFSPDGSQILYITYTDDNNNSVAIMNADGTDTRILYDDGFNNWAASFSPDGQYLLVTTYNNASDQLYLMTVDGKNAQQITVSGGNYGSWVGGS